MKNNEEWRLLEPLEQMLQYNRACDAAGREGDCILLNEDRTYVEAFTDEEEAFREIVNSGSPDFKRNEGFLITLYDDDGYYRGMQYVPEKNIWNFIDLDLIKG